MDIQSIIINTLAHLKLRDDYVKHVQSFHRYSESIDICNNFMMQDNKCDLMRYLDLEKIKNHNRMIYQESVEDTPIWMLQRINDDNFFDKDLFKVIKTVYC